MFHFTNEETESQNLRNVAKDTDPINGRIQNWLTSNLVIFHGTRLGSDPRFDTFQVLLQKGKKSLCYARQSVCMQASEGKREVC